MTPRKGEYLVRIADNAIHEVTQVTSDSVVLIAIERGTTIVDSLYRDAYNRLWLQKGDRVQDRQGVRYRIVGIEYFLGVPRVDMRTENLKGRVGESHNLTLYDVTKNYSLL